MIVETIQAYNNRRRSKWHEDCQKWQPENGGFPFLGMYIFDKNYGYVASGGRAAVWRRTKKQAIADYIKTYGIEGLK